jgi:hypothetical protein
MFFYRGGYWNAVKISGGLLLCDSYHHDEFNYTRSSPFTNFDIIIYYYCLIILLITKCLELRFGRSVIEFSLLQNALTVDEVHF